MDDNSQQPNHTPSSLFVRNLSYSVTSNSLSDFFSQVGPIKNVIIVTNPVTREPRGFAFVHYSLKEDAKRASTELNGKMFEGRSIRIDFARPKKNGVMDTLPNEVQIEEKRSRLIIRNLPWSIRENKDLEQIFIKFGGIKEINIPRRQHGLMSGFAFVTMKKQKPAEKAMKELNGIIIDGRTVAVDFALPKDQWEDVQGESEEEDMLKRKREDAELEREEHEDPSEVEAETIDSSEHSDEEMLSNGDKTPQTEKQNKSYDDCTLFVRNLLFETTEDELSHHFSKFGRLRYAKIVIDPRMNKPRGTGFICFLRPEDAKELLCLASKVPRVNAIGDSIMDPQDPDGIANQFRLNGRVLLVSKAVKREEAEKLKDDFVSKKLGKEERVDKRNLFLLNEGAIPSNHPLAQVLSTTDLQVRSQSLKQRRSLLVKNPTLHLSLTRLSVRNIPRHITSTDLKALGRNSVVQFATEVKSQKRAPLTVEEKRRGRVIQKEKKGIIKQAKIVTEDNGRSRGYGFIEFTSHRHALMGLRWLNAREIAVSDSSEENPDRTDRKRRLIVEFAIENAQVVKRRAEREQKARDNATSSKFAEITKQKKRKREEEDIQDNLEQDTKRIILQKRMQRRHKKKGGR